MMTKPVVIEKLLSRYEREAAELAGLEAAEPGIRSEIDRLLGELSDVNPRFFVLEDARNELSPEQADKLKRLESLRGKLQLIPGVIRRCETKIATLKTDQAEAVEAETASLRKLATEQRDEYERVTSAEFLARHGDTLATKRAINELVRGCAPVAAINKMMFLSTDPAAASHQLISVRASLVAFQTAANPTPASK